MLHCRQQQEGGNFIILMTDGHVQRSKHLHICGINGSEIVTNDCLNNVQIAVINCLVNGIIPILTKEIISIKLELIFIEY